MANNKVQLSDGTVLLDLTGDTVTPENLLSGATAHNAAGERISGAVAPVRYDVAQNLTSEQQKRARNNIGAAEKPKAVSVTLTAAGWNSSTKKQTVTVPGVLADTSKQVIWVTQTTEAAIDAYLEAGIVPVAQAANTVTLRADTVPTADITVNIVVQEVQ